MASSPFESTWEDKATVRVPRTREQTIMLLLAVALVMAVIAGVVSSLIVSDKWQRSSEQWIIAAKAEGHSAGFTAGFTAGNTATVVVTKSGEASYDGTYTYTKSDVYNGKPVYRLDGSHVMWYFDDGVPRYYLTPAEGNSGGYFCYGETPLIGTWNEGSGAPPAPVVKIANTDAKGDKPTG